MTTIRKLTETLSVAPFLQPRELSALAGSVRRIINNRPDGEEPGQASSAELEAAARAAGMDYIHLPVVASEIRDEDVAAFCNAIAKGEPTLAFCRTGTRSTMLWALSQAGKRPTDEILAAASAAGYDLSALAPKLQEIAAAS